MRRRSLFATVLAASLGFVVNVAYSQAGEGTSKERLPAVKTSYVKACQCRSSNCQCGTWLLQETDSFSVYCAPNLPGAAKLPALCEELREKLQETWLGKTGQSWGPKCVIVVHRSVRQYATALGPGSEQSSGCASLEIDKGVVKSRRIDLRSDAGDWLDAALPHELTHVIVADRFSRKQIPRWADEGIAILSEPESKRLRRFRAYQNNVSRTPAFAASELMSIRDYPAAGRRDAFYWQSAALVSYLVQQKSPEEFLKFVDRALDSDAATALKEIYEIPSMARLQTHWQSWSGTFERTAPTLAERDAHRPSPQPLAN